jgi:hypothetical protein
MDLRGKFGAFREDAALDIHHCHHILPLHPAQRGVYPAVET